MSYMMQAHQNLAIQRTGQIVSRDDFLDYMTFQRWIPPLFIEIFGPLPGVKEEWASQGASRQEVNMSAFRYRFAQSAGVPVSAGYYHGGTAEVIIEETDEHILGKDGMGRTVKMSKKAATLPVPLDYPVANWDDWAKIKHHYLFNPDRLSPNWEDAVREHIKQGMVISVHVPGAFDQPRQLMGEEALCLACYEEPELLQDILKTIGDCACQVIDIVTSKVQVDQIDTHEDMAGRSGPLFGPLQAETFMVPYYRRIWDLASSRGARLFSQDSDGDMTPIIPQMLKGGLNYMYPIEPTGAMDPLTIRQQYGNRLAMMGGLNKYALLHGKAAIREELERKLPPLIRSGGVVLGLDHRIPNGITIDDYRFYHATAWEIIEAVTAQCV